MQEGEPLAPNFDRDIDRIDRPAAMQDPHDGGDRRRRVGLPEGVICERESNGGELDRAGFLGRWDGHYALLSPSRAATGLLIDEDGIRT